MFIELVRKEFIQRKSESSPSLAVSLLSLGVKVIFVCFFVFVEVLITLNLDKKITGYASSSSYDFLNLTIFVFMVLGILFTTSNARKVLFSSLDRQVNTPLPISSSSILLAKATFLYIESVLLQLMLSAPVFFCYGIARNFIPYYYIFSLLFPFFISFFICAMSYIFVLFYQKIYVLIKKSDLSQFLLAILIVFLLCFAYQFVLDLFLNALNDSSIGGVISPSFLSFLHGCVKYFLPTNYYLDLLIGKEQIVSSLCLFFGFSLLSVVLGLGILSFFYPRIMKNEEKERKEKTGKRKSKITTPFKAYLKKEFILLFKEENNLFSYTSLLILCPFLTYSVIHSLNQILYSNLRFYVQYFPELTSGINLCLILLFCCVINSSASFSISRENKAIKIIKTIPLSIYKQLFIKTMIPFVFSFLSLFVTLCVLLFTNLISLSVFFSCLFLGLLMILFSNIFGIYSDMHDLNGENRVHLKGLIEAIPLVYPFVLLAFFFIGSILFHWKGVYLYLFSCLFTLVISVSLIVFVLFKFKKAFQEMEVSN